MSTEPGLKVPSEEVGALVRQRLASGRTDDGARLAIVLEGGGMRGVLSAASASVIADLGILDVADIVVGTSAGATNAVALAAGAVNELANAYIEVFTHADYINPWRTLRNRPAIASELIIREIDRRFGIASGARASHVDVAVVATDVASATSVTLTTFVDDDDVLTGISASSRLPYLGGPPVEHRGRRWLDGGVTEAVPVAAASQLGATHAVVVTTRPTTSAPSYGPTDRAVELYLRRLNPELALAYSNRPQRYRALMGELSSGRVAGMRTLTVAPSHDDPIPSRLERDRGRLRDAAAAAQARARSILASTIGG